MKKVMLLLFLLSSLSLQAEELIRSINVSGLKRTSEETFLRIIKTRAGDFWNDDMIPVIEQRLRQAGIFQSDISIQAIKDNGSVDLNIVLYDKWTLLLFPLYTVSQGESSGGAFVVDSNAFGKRHLFVGSAILSASSLNIFTLYQIPHINASDYSYMQIGILNRDTLLLKDTEGENLLGSYRRNYWGTSGRFSYDFSDNLSMGIQAGIYMWDISKIQTLDLENATYYDFPVSLRIKWKNETLYPLFKQGLSLDLDSQYILGEHPYLKEEVTLSAMIRPREWVQLGVNGFFYYSSGELNTYLLMGKKDTHFTLPDEEVASALLTSGNLEAEFRIVSLNFGSITLPLFYEAGRFESIEKDYEFYHGAGAGLRFYIDKVAVPAMGLEYHRSFSGAGGNVTFSIGASY